MNSSTADTSEPEQLVVEEIAVEEAESTELAPKPEIPDTGFLPLQDFLGMASADDEQKEKLKFIWDFFQKGRNREETLEAIKEARYRLSPPEMGENYLHKLYVYTRLLADERSIQKERKLYEGNNLVDNARPEV